jgi:predicted RNA binding protein YcfA (HicA-like mRNA interferase family)
LRRIRQGNVRNIAFADLVALVVALGFREIGGRGSHRVFAKPDVAELVNLQAEKGQAKPYQVRQVATLVHQYDLELENKA